MPLYEVTVLRVNPKSVHFWRIFLFSCICSLWIKYRYFPFFSPVSDVFIYFFRFYNEKKIVTEEIADVADFMVSLLGTDCSGEDELTYLTLRVFLFPCFLTQAIIIILILYYIITYITLLLLVERKFLSSFSLFIAARLLETWAQ